MSQPRFLHRYRPISKYTLGEIAFNCVYVCPLDRLNDEREGDFRIEPSSTDEIRVLLARMAESDNEKDIATFLREMPDLAIRDLERAMLALGSSYLDTRPLDEGVKKWGVVCFSERCDNAHMWEHYADQHRGVVIEYDLGNAAIPQDAIWKVRYDAKRGATNLATILDPANRGKFSEVLSVKDPKWAVEEEWRLLSNEVGLVVLHIPISRVITGWRASDNDKSMVVQALLKHGHARFAQMDSPSTMRIHDSLAP